MADSKGIEMLEVASVSLATVIPLIALAVTTAGGVLTWAINSIRAEHTRRQKLYADAYAAVIAYQEFPYIIRRRRASTPGNEDVAGQERQRITSALGDVQQSLGNYTALIRAESTKVSGAYDQLVSETRKIAGGAMRREWKRPAQDTDVAMNIADINLRHLTRPQDAFLAAMKEDMRWSRLAGFGRDDSKAVHSPDAHPELAVGGDDGGAG
jgi:hypothetical protein